MRIGTYTIVFNSYGQDPRPVGKFVVSNGQITSAEGMAQGSIPTGSITHFTEMRLRHFENGYYSIIGPGGYELKKSETLEKGLHGDWQKEGYKLSHVVQEPSHLDPPGTKIIRVLAHAPNGKLAADVPISYGWEETGKLLNPENTWVHPDHRRKGLATAAYKYAENLLGGKMLPGYEQSHEAHALWRNPNRPFGKSGRTPGKNIGGAVYVHRNYEHTLPKAALAQAKKHIGDFKYDIVKFNKNGNVSFIQSPDWDTAHEPMVGNSIVVTPSGQAKRFSAGKDPWIYHHKWQFVGDDYKGFDVNESKARSKAWQSLPEVDRSRIGKQSYWNANVVPKLGKSDDGAAKRALNSGLITWPKNSAKSCKDCIFLTKSKDGKDYCKNEKVNQALVNGAKNMCCNEYDNPGMTRMGAKLQKAELTKGAGMGRPAGKRPQDYDPAMIEAGVRKEMEGTDDIDIARKVAMENLDRNARHYAHLVPLKYEQKGHEVASVAFVDGDHLLMGKRNDNQHWTLPGGHLESGETPLQGAVREASEETGVELKPDDLHYLGSEWVITHGGKRLLIHSFVVFGYVNTDTEYDPDKEVQNWVWVDVSRGLPYSVEEALHSPRNTTLKLLGLQNW